MTCDSYFVKSTTGAARFCDQSIDDKSRNPARTAGARTWLRPGINHHLTFAVRRIANLPDS
jgi:hypothetical protein